MKPRPDPQTAGRAAGVPRALTVALALTFHALVPSQARADATLRMDTQGQYASRLLGDDVNKHVLPRVITTFDPTGWGFLQQSTGNAIQPTNTNVVITTMQMLRSLTANTGNNSNAALWGFFTVISLAGLTCTIAHAWSDASRAHADFKEVLFKAGARILLVLSMLLWVTGNLPYLVNYMIDAITLSNPAIAMMDDRAGVWNGMPYSNTTANGQGGNTAIAAYYTYVKRARYQMLNDYVKQVAQVLGKGNAAAQQSVYNDLLNLVLKPFLQGKAPDYGTLDAKRAQIAQAYAQATNNPDVNATLQANQKNDQQQRQAVAQSLAGKIGSMLSYAAQFLSNADVSHMAMNLFAPQIANAVGTAWQANNPVSAQTAETLDALVAAVVDAEFMQAWTALYQYARTATGTDNLAPGADWNLLKNALSPLQLNYDGLVQPAKLFRVAAYMAGIALVVAIWTLPLACLVWTALFSLPERWVPNARHLNKVLLYALYCILTAVLLSVFMSIGVNVGVNARLYDVALSAQGGPTSNPADQLSFWDLTGLLSHSTLEMRILAGLLLASPLIVLGLLKGSNDFSTSIQRAMAQGGGVIGGSLYQALTGNRGSYTSTSERKEITRARALQIMGSQPKRPPGNP